MNITLLALICCLVAQVVHCRVNIQRRVGNAVSSALIASSIFGGTIANANAASPALQTYTNDRFHTVLSYPSSWLVVCLCNFYMVQCVYTGTRTIP